MKESEGKQLLAFCCFVKSAGLDGFLRAKNWARFARGYNGADYEKNHYDSKLSVAYKQHSALQSNKEPRKPQQLAQVNQPDTGLVSNETSGEKPVIFYGYNPHRVQRRRRLSSSTRSIKTSRPIRSRLPADLPAQRSGDR
jgi:uncharacterized protein with von Willebrand factor type A (vWA) domain